MEKFQRDVLHDLGERAAELETRLTESLADPDRQRLARLAKGTLSNVQREVRRLEHDPRLANPAFDQQHRIMLERLSGDVLTIEMGMMPVLERFNQADRRLTRLTARLVEQINWPTPAPIVSATTEAGYATYPMFGVIKVPAAEDTSLLALPDMVHELGHILMMTERQRLVGDFVSVLADYITEQQQQPGQAPLSPMLFEHWRGPWLQEFVSDMIAAYVCGPVFADQHVRLISGLPSTAFRGMPSHPPDEARARGAAAVFRAMGHADQADEVSAMADRYLATTAEPRGRDYDRAMPDVLLNALAERVVRGCTELGIRSYSAPEVQRADDIVGTIQEGWRRFQTNASTYGRWQRARLAMLWRELGVGGDAPAVPHRAPSKPQRTSPAAAGGEREFAA